ncbi:FmdB family zinc ribbon protein [Achromobacter animicus]|uniref:FmdB family zinc ribbon protein n=1 Tax=Achromobacter animicus TaxID=1389935 RepID=UPI0024485720|nr:zinc ribbon domain-containing protein [Achromobacter animicus]MDH0685162.1 zinc ribbon domain-containing protein [Achromobacter animicus]
MPMYDYACADCGAFAALRRLAQWRDPAACPQCGALSDRIVGGAPAVSALSSGMNRAHAANERSANEPRSTRAGHGMNCGCCGSGRSRGRTRTSRDGAKSFAGARPWMISH